MRSSAEKRVYDPASSVVFLKTKEAFGGLSNMAPGFPLCVNGVDIRTSEALYQVSRFPDYPEIQELIIAEKSPMTAKMRSKPYRDRTRPDWMDIRVKVMRWCLRVKLAQNLNTFGGLLRQTGDAPIVEKKTRRSDFWGALEKPDGSLVGTNVLGRLLMELRTKILECEESALLVVEPPAIPNFLLLGDPVDQVSAVSSIDNPQPSLFR